jgi:hypothetical protein
LPDTRIDAAYRPEFHSVRSNAGLDFAFDFTVGIGAEQAQRASCIGLPQSKTGPATAPRLA